LTYLAAPPCRWTVLILLSLSLGCFEPEYAPEEPSAPVFPEPPNDGGVEQALLIGHHVSVTPRNPCDDYEGLTFDEEGKALLPVHFDGERTFCSRTQPRTCWLEQDRQTELGWVAYRTLTLPPGTGAEINGETNLPFAVALHIEATQGCDSEDGASCFIHEHSPKARLRASSNYLSNESEQERTYVLRFSISSIEGSAPAGISPGELQLELEQTRLGLFGHATDYTGLSCDSPWRAIPNVRLETHGRWGIRTSREPSYGLEFWELEVPAMSRVNPYTVPTALFGCLSCPCDEQRELVNDTAETVTMLAARELGERHQCSFFTFEDLAPNARCSDASELPFETSARITPRNGGTSVTRCGLQALRPHYFQASIPAGQRLEVQITPTSDIGPQSLYAVITQGCEGVCVAAAENASDSGTHTIVHDNLGDASLEVTLMVGGANPYARLDIKSRLVDIDP